MQVKYYAAASAVFPSICLSHSRCLCKKDNEFSWSYAGYLGYPTSSLTVVKLGT